MHDSEAVDPARWRAQQFVREPGAKICPRYARRSIFNQEIQRIDPSAGNFHCNTRADNDS